MWCFTALVCQRNPRHCARSETNVDVNLFSCTVLFILFDNYIDGQRYARVLFSQREHSIIDMMFPICINQAVV